MFSAQIKKGNSFLIDSLEDYLLQMILLPDNKALKTVRLPYFNFVEVMAEVISEYIKLKNVVPFNLFIADFYVRKYDKVTDLYRHFFGLTQSWKKYIETQEDAKLFLSLLTDERNNKEDIKRFHKIRKIILKTLNAKILEEIPVTHSDALTICHMLFEGENRNKVVKKINGLFISLKRKMVNTAKYTENEERINGAVACEFFMSSSEEIENLSLPLKEFHKDSIKKVSKNPITYPICQQNNNLSFSEEYANCYTKNKNLEMREAPYNEGYGTGDYSCGEEHETRYRQHDNKEYEDEFQEEYEDEEEEIERENIENRYGGMLDLGMAKQSFNQLSRKDRDIDAKLHGSGLVKLKNYPEGWDEFIQNNRMQKEKLLNGVR